MIQMNEKATNNKQSSINLRTLVVTLVAQCFKLYTKS